MSDPYFLAPSLVALRNSINKNFPKRDTSSDGWIGNAAHQATQSEHNPCWTCTGFQYGMVRATDTDVDDNDPGRDLRREILNSTIGHAAVWYVISNGIIYSVTHNWAALKYTGSNAHTKHVHVSIRKTEAAARDTSLVLKNRSLPPTTKPSSDPLGLGDSTISLWCVDRMLNAHAMGGGECFGDIRRIMAVSRILGDPAAGELELGWYSARHSESLARQRNDQDAVGAHLRHQAALCKKAIEVIQRAGNLIQDGFLGPKTQAFLKGRGYTFKNS